MNKYLINYTLFNLKMFIALISNNKSLNIRDFFLISAVF